MIHNNINILQKISNIWKPKGESLPNEVSEEISMVYNIEPDCDEIDIATAANATSATIKTTPTDRDYYLKQIQISQNRDATATSAYSDVTAVIKGVTKTLARIQTTTLVANASNNVIVQLPNALKIDRGTTINVTNTTNVANVNTTAVIYGYIID